MILGLLLFLTTSLNSFTDESVDTEKFLSVWYAEPLFTDSNRYYDFTFNGRHFSGRRDWHERWEAIHLATNFSGKRVLDLGSHIGLCSIFISKYLPIKSLVSVEKNEMYIKKHKAIQEVFHQNYPILQLNLGGDPYEEILGKDFDVIIVLSLFKWIPDKDRFLKYLSQFDAIIYEGHDSYPIELERFRKIGFPYHKLLTHTSNVKSKVRNKIRPLIFFSKSPV